MQPKRGWIFLVIAALATADAIGTAFSPYLLVERPLALLALNADDRHVVLMSGSVAYWAILAIAIPRRTLTALAAYGFGAYYGRRAIDWARQRSAIAAKIAAWIERVLRKVGAPLLIVIPGHTLGVLSGVTGMRVSTYVFFNALGQVVLISFDFFVGSLFSSCIDRFIAFVSEHALACTAVALSLVAAQQLVAAWRRRRAARERKRCPPSCDDLARIDAGPQRALRDP